MNQHGLRLSTRILAGAITIVVAGFMALIFVEESRLHENYKNELGSALEQSLKVESVRLTEAITNIRKDVLFLSNTPPISGIVRATLNHGYDARGRDSLARWEARLQQIFAAYSTAHPEYYQIRYIGVANGGREIVRVDNRGGKVEVTPYDRLQAKGDRDYFKAALVLRPGEVHVSELNLNREWGAIEQPHRPTVRGVTPVFEPTGELFGIVVINMDMSRLLTPSAPGLPAGVQAYISNMNGEYLYHPDVARAFGFELGRKDNIAADFPSLAPIFERRSPEHFPLQAAETKAGNQHLVARRIHFDPGNPARFLLLAYCIPDDVIMKQATLMPPSYIAGGFAALLLISGIVLLVLRRMFAPLEQITDAAGKIAAGHHDVVLPKAGSGEIGQLANALGIMLDKLLQREKDILRSNTELEQRVEERTRELRESEERLKEAQRIAHMGSWRLDVATNHIVWSEELYRMLGLNPELPLPDYAEHHRFFTPGSWDRLDAALSRTRETGDPYTLELEMVSADGRHGWMLARWEALRDADGSIVALQGVAADITERKRAEAQHKLVIDTSIDGFWMVDMRGNLLEANEAYAKISGYQKEELVGMHISQLEAIELSAEEVQAHIAKIVAQGYERFETRHRHKDGHEIDIEISTTYIEELQQFAAFCRDITGRKQADEAMRIAAAAIETHDAIMITDADGNIIRVNHAFSAITGYSAGEVMGKNVSVISPGQAGQDACIEMLQQSIRNGSWTGEVFDQRKNGQIYPKWMTVTAIKNERQEITHHVSIFSDISARKQVEEARLRESEERFRGTLEQAAVGIAHAALDGSFQQVNQKFCEIVGYSRDELARMSFHDITFPDDLDANIRYIQQLLAGEIPTFSMEKRYVRKDGGLVWVNLTVSLLRDAGGTPKYSIGVIEDITGRKQAEMEIYQSRKLLRELIMQSEVVREEERKHIAREVHDELGQILTALRIKVSLLRIEFGRRDAALQENIEGILDLLDHSIRCARDVVSNLRPVALEMGIIPSIKWLHDEFVGRTGIPCALYVPEEEIHLDEVLTMTVFRVVQESLTNVTKHAEASKVEIIIMQDADNFSVTVNDNGKGFDYHAISSRKSFGLLGMSERAIALGGVVNIYSAPQQGTQVFFVVPNKQTMTDTEGDNP